MYRDKDVCVCVARNFDPLFVVDQHITLTRQDHIIASGALQELAQLQRRSQINIFLARTLDALRARISPAMTCINHHDILVAYTRRGKLGLHGRRTCR